jgi:hypothetical protein
VTASRRRRSPYLEAIAADDALPIDPVAVELWVRDLQNPMRWIVRPVLQLLLAVLLHLTWALKRLPLPQFRAHRLLQRAICWFCRYFVSPEGNELILRHFATESNVLNFLRENAGSGEIVPVALYPRSIGELMTYTFVDHDQELFRVMREIGPCGSTSAPLPREALKWTSWRPLRNRFELEPGRLTQVVDFETAHALFMCLFCLLLTAEEYRDAINGFNLDQSIAIRIGRIIGDPSLTELAYNKYPLYLVGPWNLTQRFLMHGFFTEHLHARLEELRPA